jgi:hypothetical protein
LSAAASGSSSRLQVAFVWLDTPAGARLADTGRFIKYFTEDLLRHAEYWYAVITGRGQAEAGEQPPADDGAHRAATDGEQ